MDVADRLALDVDSDASVVDAVRRAGDVDALVNNAGWSARGPIEKVPLDEVRRMFETNFFGAVRMIQALVPGMRRRGGGVVVNVSSLAGRVAPPLNGFYAASKWAIEGLSEALKYEIGHFGIRTVVIEPGYIETGFGDRGSRHGTEDPPYDELERIWSGTDGKLVGGQRPGPALVAVAIADAVEGKDLRLRWPVGGDAELVTQVRRQMDDETFEATMRKQLGLEHW